MIKKTLITIITVVFNDKQNIEKTIQSVLSQTYSNIEYLIIDGGSNDGTLDIIRKYEEQIDYWVTEKDQGIYDAMNKGIRLAKGEWLNFMNSGDTFFDQETIAKIDFLNIDKHINIIYGDVNTIYSDFSVIYHTGNLKKLPYGMQFSHQSAFFRTSVHKRAMFDLKYRYASDFHSVLKFYLSNPDAFLKLPLVVSSVSVGGISEKKIYFSVYERWLIIRELGFLSLSLHSYYLALLIKQIIKSFLINDALLKWYRALKLKKKITTKYSKS